MTSFDSSSSDRQLPPNCDELNRFANARIKEYTKTALIQYDLLYTELARKKVRLDDETVESVPFSDHDVHEVLDRSGFDVRKFYDSNRDSEWYRVDLETAKSAIQAVKEGRNTLSAGEIGASSTVRDASSERGEMSSPRIQLRDEQVNCVNKTVSVFRKRDRMLWDCKMRFGKTITAYALIKKENYQKVLVVTHRPAVVDGWETDFYKIFTEGDREFLKKANIRAGDRYSAADAGIDAENDRILKNKVDHGKPFVYFASMQDLRGSRICGGKYEKNREVFAIDWDLIIYDEAHEGTQTELGLDVQKKLEEIKAVKGRKKILQLSGTPYNLLAHYQDDNIYSWDYVMEQRAKRDWNEKHPGDFNPYEELPELRICTFDLRDKIQGSYRYEDENVAFNFREFFRTWTGDLAQDFRPLPADASIGDLVHEADVNAFLDLISTESPESNYPFSTPAYRDTFRHTFWIVPGVKEARAFSALLQKHPVFGQYEIVNVAGEGDQEKPYENALAAVREAIHKSPRTITLSCGKLTTGVTVKEWTGVMLLSGSTKTEAAGYMQTIFRVQSAGSIGGKQKKVCYAFDFAPDRTLHVLADVHKLRQKASVRSEEEGRARLREFLNFCPVLAETESGMVPYDVPEMMRQLKRLTVEDAVKNGFDDDSIYKADAGIVMDHDKWQLMSELTDFLTPQKKSKRKIAIPVNEQGMTSEEYDKAEAAKHKPLTERSAEELQALKKQNELKKQRQGLLDLLRNISIRLPLLIFGTSTAFNESIRLETFIEKVDPESWEVFMPKGLKKIHFKRLLVFYDQDVIEGAGLRIRHMAKAADEMYPTQRILRIAEIFNCFKNPAKETVLTPWRVVNMHMGETIGGYSFYKDDVPAENRMLDVPRLIDRQEVTENVFLNENARVLEINSKSGVYPLYLAYSLYRMRLPKKESELSFQEAKDCWDTVLREHLFVLCQTEMAVQITKRTLCGYTGAKSNVIHLSKLLDRMDDQKRLVNKLTNPATWDKEGERMEFEAVVGNPPYQLAGASGGTNDAPVYQRFAELASALSPQYVSLLIPARWFSGGRDSLLEEFRKKMLTRKNIVSMHVYADSHDVFSTVDIKGGLCYYLQDKSYSGKCEYTLTQNGETKTFERDLGEFNVLIREPQLAEIVKKVMDQTDPEKCVDSLISGDTPFGIPTNPLKSPKNKIDLSSVKTESNQVSLLYLDSGKRMIGYVPYDLIKKNVEDIPLHKVFIPKAAGTGNDPIVVGKPELFPENSVCSQTFLYAGFTTETEAKNFISYGECQMIFRRNCS